MIAEKVKTLEMEINKRSKDFIPKMKQRRLRALTLKRVIEESPILLSQLILKKMGRHGIAPKRNCTHLLKSIKSILYA